MTHMMTRTFLLSSTRLGVGVLVCGVVLLTPAAHAQEVVAASEPAQGAGQGAGQGVENGGPTLESLGVTPDENGNYDTSVLGENDPRQGANQGADQGSADVQASAGTGTSVDASNTNTGPGSTNTAAVDTAQASTTGVANTSTVANTGTATANSGENAASENTGNATVTTGDAGVGVEQVTADNLVTAGSYGEVEHNLSAGPESGDLVLNFDPGSGEVLGDSFRSVNSVTGSGSDNAVEIDSTRETLVEIQNDGVVNNTLTAVANTGENTAGDNTGNATITTGNANVAATLLTFLNTNVVDGALWLSVSDIFGDLSGNVVIPEEAIAYLTRRQRELLVSATNEGTGSASTNSLDVDVTNTETTTIENTADVTNTVAVDAVTGQNTATKNTGNATVATGNVDATTNTVTLANMNVVDGNLGLIIVNAFNKWLGFLLGSDGTWTPIGHDYTTVVEAANSTTGADSTNTVDVDVTNTETTTIENTASVTNTLDLFANTGQNHADRNTGNAMITTGDARVNATVVNVVNTNVVRGGLFVAVVNVFGNWLGDLLFGGQSVTALAGSGGGVEIQAENRETGADSENTIDVTLEQVSDVTVKNAADIVNDITVNADTGNNLVERNTGLGSIDTGDAMSALHARNIANVTLVGVGSSWGEITADLANATTGADSENTIDVTVNDERHVTVLNDAAVDTVLAALANTGFNTASRNTLGGRVITGFAEVAALVENLLNQAWLVGGEYGDDPNTGGVSIAMTNEETGSGSMNMITAMPTVSTEADITNDATVSTTADLEANSGFNEATRNTGGGAVGSGDATLDGGIDNTANQTDVSGGTGGSVSVDIGNEASVENTATGDATSGGNTVARNTGTLPPLPSAGGGSPPPSGGAPAAGAAPPPTGGTGVSAGTHANGETDEEDLDDVGAAVAAVAADLLPGFPRIQGIHTPGTRAGAPTPRISALGPFARLPLGVAVSQVLGIPTAEAKEPQGVLPVAPAPLGDGNARLLDVTERAWPWALIAVALVLLAGVGGGWRRLADVVARRGPYNS